MAQNIKIWRKTGASTKEQLYPQTTIAQVLNLQTQLNNCVTSVNSQSPSSGNVDTLFIALYGSTSYDDIAAALGRSQVVLLEVSSILGAKTFAQFLTLTSSKVLFTAPDKDTSVLVFEITKSGNTTTYGYGPLCAKYTTFNKRTAITLSGSVSLDLATYAPDLSQRQYQPVTATGNLNLTISAYLPQEFYMLIYNNKSGGGDLNVYFNTYYEGGVSKSIHMPEDGLVIPYHKYVEVSLLPLADQLVVTCSQILS